LAELAVVALVLGEGEDGTVAEEEDAELFDVDLSGERRE
jgi:hypothetical protein